MEKTPKEKALELVTFNYKLWIDTDIYWDPTYYSKEASIGYIDLISDNSDYWMEVKKEIELLPESIKGLIEG